MQVAVCGPAQCTDAEARAAFEVGRQLARHGAVVLCGGGSGVMAAAAAGARSLDGVVVGIRPGADPGPAAADLTVVLTTDLGEARNAVLVASADAVIRPVRRRSAVLASYAMGRADLERWAGPGPLNTDAYPHLEFQAPRSNVMPRDELVKHTIALFEALGGTSREVLPPLKDYAPAREGGATQAAAYEALATEHARLLRPERARIALEAAVAADPRSASAHATLGDLLIARGRAGEAEPHLRAAVELDPSDLDSFNALAGLYLEQREMEKAERAHRDLVRHHPGYVPGHLRLGAILARRGARAESRAQLRGGAAARSRGPGGPGAARVPGPAGVRAAALAAVRAYRYFSSSKRPFAASSGAHRSPSSRDARAARCRRWKSSMLDARPRSPPR